VDEFFKSKPERPLVLPTSQAIVFVSPSGQRRHLHLSEAGSANPADVVAPGVNDTSIELHDRMVLHQHS